MNSVIQLHADVVRKLQDFKGSDIVPFILTDLSIKTPNDFCTIEIRTSMTSCHSLHRNENRPERKLNMYDSHFDILLSYTRLRPFRRVTR